MIVFLNGKFVPEAQAVVSIFDRGFLYGDGLFEAIRICSGRPFRWAQHWDRLQKGADLLKLKIPFASDELLKCAQELSAKNQMPEAILRVSLSRGIGERGYSPKGADKPFLAMSLYPVPSIDFNKPPLRKVFVAKISVPANHPLTAIKSTNKLINILARAEADAFGADEALLVNTNGDLAEGTSVQPLLGRRQHCFHAAHRKRCAAGHHAQSSFGDLCEGFYSDERSHAQTRCAFCSRWSFSLAHDDGRC